MTKIIIDIFMYIFEGLLIFHYSNTIFTLKKSKTIQIVYITLSTLILFTIYQLNITYLNAILFFAINSLLFYCLYNISFRTAIFHSFIFLVVMLACEFLVLAISSVFDGDFNTFENNTLTYLLTVITSKLIYFGLIMTILKLFAKTENSEQPNKNYWLLFVMPLTNIMVLICFRYITYQIELNRITIILWIISCLGILFANILVFIIYENSIKNTKELYEIKAIQHQEEQDKKYFDVIEQSNKEMRVFSHDIKNHLMQIRNLDDIDAVRAYVDKLCPDIEKFNYIGISKNKMLDLIISKYTTLCESKNIKFRVDAKTANLDYIDDVDLSTLMNNLLDNSIEAAEKSSNPFVQINIFSKNNQYDGLVIKNSCDAPPEIESGELRTTKHNKKSHGMGIKSIKKIIKKYNAIYDWKYDKAQMIFETDIVFAKKN